MRKLPIIMLPLVAVMFGCEADKPEPTLVAKQQAIVNAFAQQVSSYPPLLSCVVTFLHQNMLHGPKFAPPIACDDSELSSTIVRYGFEFEGTKPAATPDGEGNQQVVFMVVGADSLRMRVYPIDMLGRTGCAHQDTSWSEWSDWFVQ